MNRCIQHLKDYKKQLILGPMFKILEAIFELIVPFIVAFIIDEGTKTNDTNFVIGYGALIVGLGILGLFSTMVCQYFASVASQGYGTKLRDSLYTKLFKISKEDLERLGKGNLQTAITNDINQMQLVVAMIIRLVVRAPFLVIGALVCSFIINVQIGLIFLGITIIIAIVLFVFIKVTSKKYLKVQEAMDEITIKTTEALEGTRVIRAFNKEEETRKSYDNVIKERKDRAFGVDVINALLNPIVFSIINFAIILIIYFGGAKIEAGTLSSGDVVALINYLNQILIALIVVINLVVIFTKGFASMKRINKILDIKEIENVGILKEISLENGKNIFEFNNISFSFEDNKQHKVLNNISFKVKKGEIIGIIGGTASGKTTLLNLITRFYKPTEGNILYKGHEIDKFELKNYRNEIAYVTQKPSLLKGSIKDNLEFGTLHSEEDIKKALDISSSLEFVEEKENKLNTEILESGKNFSGGQKQRLSISRGLLKNAEVLILDDSFSALDYLTERKIRNNIKEFSKTKNLTTFIVSQRINSLKYCDKIIVLDQGILVDLGNHDELLSRCELYKEIYCSQERGE